MIVNDAFNALSAQRLLLVWRALQNEKIHVAPFQDRYASELKSAPLTMTGLVDTARLSEQTINFALSLGQMMETAQTIDTEISTDARPIREIQIDLFALYAKLFSALIGRAPELIISRQEIKERLIERYTQDPETINREYSEAAEELIAFYKLTATQSYQHAKQLGGMKLVTGGQRSFSETAFNAVRITGLYADTQLIPDPIYPFFSANLSLNAERLQLAISLYTILKLRPLIDLDLLVPPIVVFPSFEQALEENDAFTKNGIEQLIIRVVGPYCKETIKSFDQLFDYAKKRGEVFAQELLNAKLFVPPNGQLDRNWQVREAVQEYLKALQGIRSEAALDQMRRLKPEHLLLIGVMERLRPHYHLLENASELSAQPLLSQQNQWHYFTRCAQANAQDLRNNKILSEQAFSTLQAVQDNSLTWLANIPISALGHLIANDEHRWLREELNKYTSQLSCAGEITTDEMIREVNHGLTALVKRQGIAMAEIEKKYDPKNKWIGLATLGGISVAAGTIMIPALAPLVGSSAPIVAAAALGTGALAYAKEKFSKSVEKRNAQRSVLGILALAKSKTKE